jgi:hypothetical protein
MKTVKMQGKAMKISYLNKETVRRDKEMTCEEIVDVLKFLD